MAYIELEAVIETVKKEREYFGKFSYEEEPAFMVGFHQAITFALSDISSIPAADVRPVVRGRWISNRDGETVIQIKDGEPQGSCSCSVCGEWLVASEEYAVKGNYCPNCGADMRQTEEK